MDFSFFLLLSAVVGRLAFTGLIIVVSTVTAIDIYYPHVFNDERKAC